MTGLPQAAIDAAVDAAHASEEDRIFALAVLHAAAPHIAAAERERLRGVLRQNPLIMTDPVLIARLLADPEGDTT